MNREPTIGVLAFQGDFAEHLDVLGTLNVNAIEVRSLEDLAKVDGLIIPGGESTVIARFLKETGVGEEIVKRTQRGILPAGTKKLSVYGTCAGAIVLAKEATGKNAPKPLGLIDITIDRNAYGSQVDSFEATIRVEMPHRRDARSGVSTKQHTKQKTFENIPVAFIRAPKIKRAGKDVEVLAKHKGLPVLVRQGNVLAGTFHPEVRGENRIHRLFLDMVLR